MSQPDERNKDRCPTLRGSRPIAAPLYACSRVCTGMLTNAAPTVPWRGGGRPEAHVSILEGYLESRRRQPGHGLGQADPAQVQPRPLPDRSDARFDIRERHLSETPPARPRCGRLDQLLSRLVAAQTEIDSWLVGVGVANCVEVLSAPPQAG